MAGYLGTKAVLLSTTAADVVGNAEIGGDLTVGGAFTSQGIDDNASATAMTLDASGNVGIGTDSVDYTAANRTVVHIEGSSGALLAMEDTGAKSYFFQSGNDLLLENDTSTGSMIFGTNSSTERMRIDSSGNVGIGTSSPVNNSNRTTLGLNGAWGGQLDIMVGSTVHAQFGTDNFGSGQSARIQSQDGIVFNTNGGNERMRIDASGNLLVGGSTDLGAGVTQLTDRSGRWALTTNCENASGGTYYHWNIKSGGSNAGSVTGTTTATSFNTSSDYRLKTDAQPMTGASARVQALNPVNFEWVSTGERVDGFLAHEAQEVVPEAVTGAKDAMRDEEYEVTPAVYEDVVIPAVLDEEGNELEAERTEQRLVSEAVMGTRSVPDYQGIDQSKLVPLLTAALQEALTEIADLKARVTALEAV